MTTQLPSPEAWRAAAEIYRDFEKRHPQIAAQLKTSRMRLHDKAALAKRMGSAWSIQSIDYQLKALRKDLRGVISARELKTAVAARDVYLKRSIETLEGATK